LNKISKSGQGQHSVYFVGYTVPPHTQLRNRNTSKYISSKISCVRCGPYHTYHVNFFFITVSLLAVRVLSSVPCVHAALLFARLLLRLAFFLHLLCITTCFYACEMRPLCSLPLWRVHEIKHMYLDSCTHGLFIT
jgi:hypothetical protein